MGHRCHVIDRQRLVVTAGIGVADADPTVMRLDCISQEGQRLGWRAVLYRHLAGDQVRLMGPCILGKSSIHKVVEYCQGSLFIHG